MAKNKLNKKVFEALKTLHTKFSQVIYNYFPDLKRLLKNTDDKRHQSYIDYPREYVHFFVILTFIFRVKASRLAMIELLGESIIDNINSILGTDLDKIIHEGTISYFYNYEEYNSDALLKIPAQLIRNIIRRRTFEKFRLLDKWYLIAVDGTGIISFNERHCDKCLTKTMPDGKTYYFHNVLTAHLVLWTGYTFPIDFEFIENPGNGEFTKQDIEYKAFKRMFPRLKKNFPQERFCFLLDGLYANSIIMSMIESAKWKFLIALKDKGLKTINEDFEGLFKLNKKNSIQIDKQFARFVPGMKWKGCDFSVIESIEPHSSPNAKSDTLKLKYLTNVYVSKSNVIKLINQGGRQRSVIENQGYNVLKNDYSLKHPFRIDSLEAIKSVICLTCIAYIIFQFFIVAVFKSKQIVFELFRAIKVLADKLKYSFCNKHIGNFLLPMRISFDSS